MALPRGTREAALGLIVATAVTLVFALLANTTVVRGLETASLDLRFRIRGVQTPGPEATVILVDDRSLAALGRWPLSRHLFARALTLLQEADAKLVVFDILFAEPDQPVPLELRDDARVAANALSQDSDKRLRSRLLRLADDDPDAEFAAAIKTHGKVLLPVSFDFQGVTDKTPVDLGDNVYLRFDKSPVKPEPTLTPTSVGLPIPVLAKAALGLGSVSVAYDFDGAPRYDYPAWNYQGDFVPSLPVRATAEYLGMPWPEVGLALGEGIHLGQRTIPTDTAMRLLVNYRGPRGTFPTFSFVDLLQGRIPVAALQGHIVLVGGSFTGNPDAVATPFGSTPIPGTERLATIVDTILRGDFIADHPPLWTLISLLTALALAALAGAGTALLPTRAAFLAGGAPVLAWFAAMQLAFNHGFWLPLVQPIVALAAAMLAVLLFRYWAVDRQGRRIRTAFQYYMAPNLVELLAAHPERLKLGGETRAMTMLFCDIRGFTSISERLKSDPQALTSLINRFLTPMTEVILAHHGTIDKFIGDCIMAFWNAPLDVNEHADQACDGALAMLEALAGLNAELKKEAAAIGQPFTSLRVGIGINSGECVVGNMGSEKRFDYSVLGDAVNLAARLEGQTKTYGVEIVIGEATRAKMHPRATLELDLIAVKGKQEAVRVYTLLGDGSMAETPAFKSHVARHDDLLASYRAQDWPRARVALVACRGFDDRLTSLYDLYDERIAYYAVHPPGPDWDGVFVAKSK